MRLLRAFHPAAPAGFELTERHLLTIRGSTARAPCAVLVPLHGPAFAPRAGLAPHIEWPA
jgi:hypothetical protein